MQTFQHPVDGLGATEVNSINIGGKDKPCARSSNLLQVTDPVAVNRLPQTAEDSRRTS